MAGEVFATVAVRQQQARHSSLPCSGLHSAYSRRFTAGSKVVPFLSLAACCKSCDKVRYRNNRFLELVCVYMRHACRVHVGTAQVPRVRTATAFRALSLRTFDRLDCAANAKINLRCI